MKPLVLIRWSLAFATFMAAISSAFASPFTLTNGTGDGSLSVGVDGFGSFGTFVGPDSADAVYNPLFSFTYGDPMAVSTTYQSGIAFGTGGTRTFLTSGAIANSGGLVNPMVTGSPTSGNSMFSFGGLSFTLTQSLTTLTAGTRLDQVYSITNPGSSTANFDLTRYFDGDLRYAPGQNIINNEGGRLFLNGTEVLFETASYSLFNPPGDASFVGISATGGTIPTTGRYAVSEIEPTPTPPFILSYSIVNGDALSDSIVRDIDGDQISDYLVDVNLALNNQFSLAPGATTIYTTSTIFGGGTPVKNTIPEPATLVLMGFGLACLGFSRKRKKSS